MTETAKGIYQSSVPFSVLLQELSLVIPENVRLQTLTATVPVSMQPSGAAAETATGAAAPTDVTFTGQTEKHRDVAEFMTRLGLIPQLMDITLTTSSDVSSAATATTTTSFKQFTVTARLRPYTTAPPTTQLQEVAP
jgi:Tfp pilus assembly protein PilN